MDLLEYIPNEIIFEICEYLSYFDAVNFLSCREYLKNLINILPNRMGIDLTEDLLRLENYNCFTYLKRVYFLPDKFPAMIKKISFGIYFDEDIRDKIPPTVTHITFGKDFNQKINGCIPNGVTHLTFGIKFNQDIKGCIPGSVTHLTFGCNFDQNIDGCIPDSVIHLTFGYCFNQNIECIPESVTQLILPTRYRGKYQFHEEMKVQFI